MKNEDVAAPPRNHRKIRRRSGNSAPPAPEAPPEARVVRRLQPRNKWRETETVFPDLHWVQLRVLESNIAYIEVCSLASGEMHPKSNRGVDTYADRMDVAVREKYGEKFATVFSIWMDTLMLRGVVGPSAHSGEHCDAIAIIVNHCNFRKWLLQFKGEYIQCMHNVQANDTMKIMCVSHDGKHASVSCARILSHILCHKAKEPIHFDQKNWKNLASATVIATIAILIHATMRRQKLLERPNACWEELFNLV